MASNLRYNATQSSYGFVRRHRSGAVAALALFKIVSIFVIANDFFLLANTHLHVGQIAGVQTDFDVIVAKRLLFTTHITTENSEQIDRSNVPCERCRSLDESAFRRRRSATVRGENNARSDECTTQNRDNKTKSKHITWRLSTRPRLLMISAHSSCSVYNIVRLQTNAKHTRTQTRQDHTNRKHKHTRSERALNRRQRAIVVRARVHVPVFVRWVVVVVTDSAKSR